MQADSGKDVPRAEPCAKRAGADHARPLHTLTHEAMATRFTLTIVQADALYARQAAAAAFAELDRIENRLSRYAEGSDVFRINRLRAGQATPVHRDAFECLRIALDVQHVTGGAFDVTYASDARASRPRLRLEAETHAVRVLADGVHVDLGGIGKGFALDRMAALLADWDIDAALLSAASSTILALGPPPHASGWAITFGPDGEPLRRRLVLAAFSASGTGRKGDHILDPRSGRPAARWRRVWAGAPEAAVADALSTALMVMTEKEIRDYCRRPRVSAFGITSSEKFVCLADRLQTPEVRQGPPEI